MKLRVEKMGINGEGIGYDVKKRPVFIEGALQGEEVEVEITDKQAKYARAKLLRVLKKSNDRREPECKFHKKCGACSLMHVNYERQLEYKYDILRQSLIKYAQINPKLIKPVKKSSCEYAYRNSFKLPLKMDDGELTCGIYMTGSNFFIPIDSCPVQEDGLEVIRNEIMSVLNKHNMKDFDFKAKLGLRTLIVRGFQGSFQCCIISGNDRFEDEVVNELMAIEGLDSLWQSVHLNKFMVEPYGKVMVHLGGNRSLPFKHRGLNLNLSVKSFFQLNTKQAETLYQVVEGMVSDDNEFIVEAYSGIGAISLSLHKKAKEIIGIEEVNDAVSNANQNAQRNHIDNVKFVCGDAAEKLMQYSKRKQVDVLIVDPPRTGLDEPMLACILRSRMKSIVYVSSNPATLAKNLSVLSKDYIVEKIVPVDMFAHTSHIQTVTLLKRKR